MYELKISAAGCTSHALGKFCTLKAARAYQLTVAQAYALGINEGETYMRVIQKISAAAKKEKSK
jgi:hypothetical protein